MIALTMDDLRRQGQQGLLGTQMTAVIVEAKRPNGKTTYKRYRLPTEKELQAAVAKKLKISRRHSLTFRSGFPRNLYPR